MSAQVSIQRIGAGCGPTLALPYIHDGELRFIARDDYTSLWPCTGTNGSPGWLIVALSLPSPQETPVPSIHKGCILKGLTAAMLPAVYTFRTGTSVTIGKVPAQIDIYVQGVFLLRKSGNGGKTTCPDYLSVTPAWRVKK